jgi:PTH1 family peptidyl-tRNA hydrolase
MNLIIGLGNPGEKYVRNRHNAGFLFADFLNGKSSNRKEWKFDKYTLSEVSDVEINSNDFLLESIIAKPRTFMNKSGQAANELIKKYEIPVENLIVIHDDLDMELGNFKIQKGTGPKVHNGLTSIESSLRRNDFLRIRIGVDNRHGDFRMPGEAYVLQNFPEDEKKILEETFPKILERLILSLKHN